MYCVKCGYKWEPRKQDPKSCPRCKTRLDYNPLRTGTEVNPLSKAESTALGYPPITIGEGETKEVTWTIPMDGGLPKRQLKTTKKEEK